MWVRGWMGLLAVAVALCLGCESVPQHEIPELYPASGPTGLRTGFSYQNNIETDSGFPYYDASDFWERGFGGTVELPVDMSPYWGIFFGVGYEHFSGGDDSFTDAGGAQHNVKVDSIDLIPFYVGVTGRIPYWLDEEKWEQEVDPVWLTNDPVGFAPYVRGIVGGAGLVSSPDMVDRDTGATDRILDYQIFPFIEGSLGLEYRERSVGYWAEVGYRLYIIPDRENGSFGDDRMARMNGIRAMVGVTWYLW